VEEGSGFARSYAGTGSVQNCVRSGRACPGVGQNAVLNEAWWAARDSITARDSDLWFMAHPKEEPLNHSLATVQRGARRAPATRREAAAHGSGRGADGQRRSRAIRCFRRDTAREARE
jgi:hypothetical protein